MFETDTYRTVRIREFKMKYQVNKDTVYYYAKINTQKLGVIYKRVGKQKQLLLVIYVLLIHQHFILIARIVK